MHAKAPVTKNENKLCKPCCKIKPPVNCKRCARTRQKTRFWVNVGVILVIFQVRTDLKKRPKDINHGEHMYFACLLHWLRSFCQGYLSIKMRCGTLRAGCNDITLTSNKAPWSFQPGNLTILPRSCSSSSLFSSSSLCQSCFHFRVLNKKGISLIHFFGIA